MRSAMLAAFLLAPIIAVAPPASASACEGVDVRPLGHAQGCVAVVVAGKAEGRVAIAVIGAAEGGTIAFVGYGCASQNEEGIAAGVANTCMGVSLL